MIFLFCLCAFASSVLLTYLIRAYALHKSLLDIPNQRSSHLIPTPRGGGLSIVLVFLTCSFALKLFNLISLADQTLLGLGISSALVAGIGFCDDHQHIPARWRLAVHSLAALIVLILLPQLPGLPLFSYQFELSILNFGLYLLICVWCLNLYNFMDGIDGIASIEAISIALNTALLLVIQQQPDWALLLALLAICVAGFLVWNYPPAKIFMGDACSGFLGFILAVFALSTSASSTVNIWSWLILLGVFFTDATFTLAKRVYTGQIWYAAHCTHAYQNYARTLIKQFQQHGFEPQQARAKAHLQINLYLLAINSLWLLPLAALASFYPYWSFLLTLIALLPLVLLANRLKAGMLI